MGKLDGKVAVITGGARGQGRSHAVTFAREGADVVVCDIAAQIDTVPFAMGTEDDLAETVKLVEDLDRRCVAVKADVRSLAEMEGVAERAVAEFGRIDILAANAGIGSFMPLADMSEQAWQDVIDTNLTGVFHSFRAVVPQMIGQGSGRIVATSSMAGRMGIANIAHYVAAKWGVIGLVKSLALEVAGKGITVNAVLPTNVNTPMLRNDAIYRLFRPDLDAPTLDDALEAYQQSNAIPIPWVEASDISSAILFLVSDDARYITGHALPVAAGGDARNAI